jgi:DNA polymerase/3'-5' exonuclease PolX
MSQWINLEVASRLEDMARRLPIDVAEEEIAAYRRAAAAVRALRRPVSEILHGEGLTGLERIAGVSPSLALGIRDLVRSGRLPALDRLLAAEPAGIESSWRG